MNALVDALLAWLEEAADYATDDFLPPVVREPSAVALTAELRGELHDSIAPGAADLGCTPRIRGRTVGMASLTSGMEPGEPPLESPVFGERLLFRERPPHELVHHVRLRTGAYTVFERSTSVTRRSMAISQLPALADPTARPLAPPGVTARFTEDSK